MLVERTPEVYGIISYDTDLSVILCGNRGLIQISPRKLDSKKVSQVVTNTSHMPPASSVRVLLSDP